MYFECVLVIDWFVDRPGLRYVEQVERVGNIITQGLQRLMKVNHPDDSCKPQFYVYRHLFIIGLCFVIACFHELYVFVL